MRTGGIKHIPKLAVDLLYPARCPFCQDIAPWGTDICPECRAQLPVISSGRCIRCGKPVEDGDIYCRECGNGGHLFDEGLGIYPYTGVWRTAISGLKYKGRKEYGRTFGRLIFENAAGRLDRWRPQVIVPVPVHRARLAARGYNQAEVIACEVSIKSRIPLRADGLVRTGETLAMKNLGRAERFENLRGVLAVSPDFRVPDRVLLIDDIYTTGATLDACSAVLKEAGADRVYFLTVCTGGGFMVQY